MKYMFLIILLPFIMDAQDLQKHQWKNRIIVVFSSGSENKEAKEQLDILKTDVAALKERKLVVYHITNSGYTVDFGEEISALKNTENSIRSFKVVLIGLDGTEKFSATQVERPEKFFRLIDSMPMRQAEIKRKNEE